MADVLILPIAISHIQGRYLLFDIDAIAYLRKHHRICGVFIGTLPQNPSQNVFMGLPMEIMPEEAQLLVDESIGYILDDPRAHDAALARTNRKKQGWYVQENESRAAEIAEEKVREKQFEKKKALKKVKAKQGVDSMDSSAETVTAIPVEQTIHDDHTSDPTHHTDSLFDPQPSHPNSTPSHPQPQTTYTITPTTSLPLLQGPDPPTTPQRIPTLNTPSYPLYKHLNSKGYFQTPGLRFGCQFCVYPGDPLRFHSHFLAVGYDWNQEVDLMDLVGGGRLGTGVKKGWLVGGRGPPGVGEADGEGKVRTWSVEWAGM